MFTYPYGDQTQNFYFTKAMLKQKIQISKSDYDKEAVEVDKDTTQHKDTFLFSLRAPLLEHCFFEGKNQQ